MSTQTMVVESSSVARTSPGGLAIFCFIIGAPHIYGVIQSHHRYPQLPATPLNGKKAVAGKILFLRIISITLVGLGCVAGLGWVYGF